MKEHKPFQMICVEPGEYLQLGIAYTVMKDDVRRIMVLDDSGGYKWYRKNRFVGV